MKRNLKIIYFLSFLLAAPVMLLAQERKGISIEAVVLDASNGSVLPLVNIREMNSGKGTVTNRDGWFRMESLDDSDSLIFSFVGFQTLILSLDQVLERNEIMLSPQINLLEEVSVYSDNTFLYSLVSDLKKNRSKSLQEARTYFSLNSFFGEKRVELIECYYNAGYRSGDLQYMNLKNGRIVVDKYKNRYFVNRETSQPIAEFRTFQKNDYFPESPFHMGATNIKKHYDLSVRSRTIGEDGHVMYVVQFSPLSDKDSYFSGVAWIDSNTRQLQRYEMQVFDAERHPFQALWETDSILSMDLYIAKSFPSQTEDHIQSDFHFELFYQDREGSEYHVRTEAFLMAYNFEDPFFEPYSFSTELPLNDYRRILAAPYNDFFWKHIDEFYLGELKDKNEEFAHRKGREKEQDELVTGAAEKATWIEGHEIFWSDKRVVFKEELPQGLAYSDLVSWIPNQRYRLSAHIFLDRNELSDSLHFLSATVFDPYNTYFYYPIDNTALAFINLYFDLVELQRRNMMEEIESSDKSLDEVNRIYAFWSERVESITAKYLREVDRGTDLGAYYKWNSIIEKELGINNAQLFDLPGSGN
jgi:hypothetical protein